MRGVRFLKACLKMIIGTKKYTLKSRFRDSFKTLSALLLSRLRNEDSFFIFLEISPFPNQTGACLIQIWKQSKSSFLLLSFSNELAWFSNPRLTSTDSDHLGPFLSSICGIVFFLKKIRTFRMFDSIICQYNQFLIENLLQHSSAKLSTLILHTQPHHKSKP